MTLIDLADYDIAYSDGRNYLEYEGDTKYVAEQIMGADTLIIATPVFQASIPGVLKDVLDLLPEGALLNKVVGIVVTAGSSKHYLTIQQQLVPILSYMKAQVVQSYVFVEEKDFHRKQIINDDVLFRIERLVEDTGVLSETLAQIRQAKEDAYGF